jgi:hypothetical protein
MWWLGAAAMVLLFIGYWDEIFPHPKGAHAPPGTTQGGSGNRPTPRDLRDRAETMCGAKKWKECKQLLDLAAWDDPAGDKDERVKKMRGEIADGVKGQ